MLHGGNVLGTARRLGRDYRELMDFSANLNMDGCPAEVREAAQEGLSRLGVYPDVSQQELREALGAREGIAPGCLIAGNGAAELIFAICWGIRPHRALVAVPTFLEYERALRSCGAQVEQFAMEAPGDHPADLQLGPGYIGHLLRLTEGDLAVLCTPNNPTGIAIEEGLLEEIIGLCEERGIYLLLDECFLNFTLTGRSRIQKAAVSKVLIVLKSFTKMYGMPGLRLGYAAIGDAAVRGAVRSCMQEWSVSCAAEAAGTAICRMGDRAAAFERRTAKRTAAARKELREGLMEAGAFVSHGEANYLLFAMPGCRDLDRQLLQEGILIRSCGNYPLLTEEYYRTAVRSREENERLLNAIHRWRMRCRNPL